jgi:hypothetical protein
MSLIPKLSKNFKRKSLELIFKETFLKLNSFKASFKTIRVSTSTKLESLLIVSISH